MKKAKNKEMHDTQLTAQQTIKALIECLQEEEQIDMQQIKQYTQLTWNKGIASIVPIERMKDAIKKGNVGIMERHILSDNCIIYELSTITGKYSIKVICEEEPYKPSSKGIWGVNPLSLYKIP